MVPVTGREDPRPEFLEGRTTGPPSDQLSLPGPSEEPPVPGPRLLLPTSPPFSRGPDVLCDTRNQSLLDLLPIGPTSDHHSPLSIRLYLSHRPGEPGSLQTDTGL